MPPSIAVLMGKKPVDDGGDDAPPDSEPSPPDGDMVEHQHAAMEAFVKAVKDGGTASALSAFKSLLDLCDEDNSSEV